MVWMVVRLAARALHSLQHPRRTKGSMMGEKQIETTPNSVTPPSAKDGVNLNPIPGTRPPLQHEPIDPELVAEAVEIATEALASPPQVEGPCEHCGGEGSIEVSETQYGSPIYKPCLACSVKVQDGRFKNEVIEGEFYYIYEADGEIFRRKVNGGGVYIGRLGEDDEPLEVLGLLDAEARHFATQAPQQVVEGPYKQGDKLEIQTVMDLGDPAEKTFPRTETTTAPPTQPHHTQLREAKMTETQDNLDSTTKPQVSDEKLGTTNPKGQGVAAEPDLWEAGFGVVETALNWFTLNYRTTDEEVAAIALARQILAAALALPVRVQDEDEKDYASADASVASEELPSGEEARVADTGQCDSCHKDVPTDELGFSAYESNGVGDGDFCEACRSWDGR